MRAILLALATILPTGPMRAAVDVVEVNASLHPQGGVRFVQVIYWVRSGRQLHVAEWEMWSDHAIYRAGDRWIVHRRDRVIRAPRLFVTRSVVDPEVRDRRFFRPQLRKGVR